MTTYRGPGDSANSGQSVTVLADQAAASATAAQVAQAASEAAQTASETAQTAAETAQTAAETAQTAAETALDSFDDRYLGAKASDPTLDNDGNALITGALYFNTTSGKMMVYGGAAWVPSSVQGINSNADATAITIDSNENVGIGASAGTNERLHVSASTLDTGWAGLPTIMVLSSTAALGAGVGPGIGFQAVYTGSSVTDLAVISGVKENATDGNYSGALLLGTRANGGNVEERMRILGAGSVVLSLGAASAWNNAPGEGFTFDYTGGISRIRASSAAGNNRSIQLSGLSAGTPNANQLHLDFAGNVGVGTSSPQYPLDVQSTTTNGIRITSTDATANEGPFLTLWRNSASPAALDALASIYFQGEDSVSNTTTYARINAYIEDPNNGTEDGALVFSTTRASSLTEAVRITGSGNVGIGTATPARKVSISGTGAQILQITNTTLGETAIDGSELQVDTSGNCYLINRENAPLIFMTNGSNERMRIDSSGNVGIGVSPSNALHVSKADGGNYIAAFQNGGTPNPYGLYIYFSGASPDNNTSTFLACNDSTTTRCLIYSDGDLANHDGTYGTISDAKFKTDITPARSQWEDIKALGAIAVNYRMKTDIEQYGEDAHYLLGWIAQDVQKVSPGLVKEAGDPEDPYLVLKQSIIGNKVAIALAEALVRIEQLESTIASLQQQQ